jgi:hypothetical protein
MQEADLKASILTTPRLFEREALSSQNQRTFDDITCQPEKLTPPRQIEMQQEQPVNLTQDGARRRQTMAKMADLDG